MRWELLAAVLAVVAVIACLLTAASCDRPVDEDGARLERELGDWPISLAPRAPAIYPTEREELTR